MGQPGQVERLWWPRLRWRMRGAWQWPAFAALTLLDGVLLTQLPFYGRGPGSLFAGLLIAGFVNLFAVGIVAPLVGRRLRRRRTDLPRLVANDYAGTVMLVVFACLFLAGGLVHRPAIAAEERDVGAVATATHDYVTAQEPAYQDGLGSIDAIRVEQDLYRACVPGSDPQEWLCLFVSTDQRPAGVTRDPDRAPNAAYQRFGGFR